jgi:proteasome lid subunit RPN8/RPN11
MAQVRLSAAIRRAMVREALTARPRECCGLLVGHRQSIVAILPMQNVAESPETRFKVDDAAHIEARRLLRRLHPPIEIVGVYHSHPSGPPVPSPVDVAEAHYPDWIHVVIGLGGRRPVLRAFRIVNGRAHRHRLAR